MTSQQDEGETDYLLSRGNGIMSKSLRKATSLDVESSKNRQELIAYSGCSLCKIRAFKPFYGWLLRIKPFKLLAHQGAKRISILCKVMK